MKIVDLTEALRDGMEVYEGDPPVRIAQVRTRAADGWELREISMGSHTGTHCDAPIHMHEGAATLDELPLSRFCGTAYAISCSDAPFLHGVGLIFTDPVGAGDVPAILDAEPNFVAGELDEAAERELLGRGIVTYTDLVNVNELPRGTPFQFYGFPLRIEKGDGSPVRAVAIIQDEK